MRFLNFYESNDNTRTLPFKIEKKEVVTETTLPPGFTANDIGTVDQFIKQEQKNGDEIDVDINEEMIDELEAGDAEISDIDIDKLKQQRLNPQSKGTEIGKKPEKMLHKSNIIDDDGNLIPNDVLKNKIMQRPTILISQNKKLAKSGSKTDQVFYDSTLPSYMGLFVDESTGEFKTVKTCPSAGECTKFCYAAKGGYIQFPASSLGASRTVNYLMNDPDGFKNQLVSELNAAVKKESKHGKKVVLRWHDSGDFLSEKYVLLAFDVAKQTPDVLHYTYTKQIPLIRKLESYKPKNFVFNFSFGGLHDVDINVKKEKHAQVVPANLFKDLEATKTPEEVIYPAKSIKKLKQRVADNFNIDVNTILTYDEMLDKPISKSKKYNVLVWKGHGDDAATRQDVLGTYLLFH